MLFRSVVAGSPEQTKYPARTVFINEKMDVAVIKATGLNPKKWANVRLGQDTKKGESIVAIGNPALSGGYINVGGATAGIISNPLLQDDGRSRLICDITIASGSSGGPIFSMATGEVVGVVQAVTQMGINETGVSSSGYFAMAAPSQMLGEWLGLQY